MATVGRLIANLFDDGMFLFCLMLFIHLFADFKLQIACHMDKMKQWRWWKEQCFTHVENPQVARRLFFKYRYDYLCVLLCHGFMWSFLTFLPLAGNPSENFVSIVFINAVVHAVVDDAKANRHMITLWTDQILHVAQIAITLWICG